MASRDDPQAGAKRRWTGLLSARRDDGDDLPARIARLEAHYGRLPDDFHADRYVEIHPDLAALRGDVFGASKHYLQWGRNEGRDYRTRIEVLQDEFGQLPADFDAGRYVDLHPDLEPFRADPDAATSHYLHYGRVEGRPYKRLRREVEAAKPVDIDRKVDRAEAPVADRRDWRNRFDAAHFRALHPDLSERARDRAEARQLFATEGVARLAPLSLDDRFEPVFYRNRTPEAAALDPPSAYRHWLEIGMAAGRAGSESELVEALIGTRVFPEGFDWQAYARLVGSAAGLTTRADALEHAVETGVDDPARLPVRGSGAAVFLERVAASQWTRSRRRLALGLIERAIALDPEAGLPHWTLAVWSEELNDLPKAEAHYREAKRLGYRSVAFVAKLAALAVGHGAFDEAYAELAAAKPAFEGHGAWTDAVTATLDQDFAEAAEAALDHYRKGERDRGDARLMATLARMTCQIEVLDDLPAPLPPVPHGHVVLFANHGLPQCRHYRIEQRCRQLDHLAIPYRLFDSTQAGKAREALAGARALVVYREPAYAETIRLILHARAMGVPVFYEIDDLIFDAAHYPDDFETYRKQIPFEDYVGLLYGVPLFRFAATLCDAGIASTDALAGHLGPLTRSRTCHVIPNGLDERNDRFLEAPPIARSDDDILVFYGSGTKAHDRNFNDTLAPALAEVMAQRPRVRLVVVGYLDLGESLAPLADRILRFDFTTDLDAYWAALSEADINLAVLVPGAMNDAKSAIKWLEAAVSAVPSIVSATATYRVAIEDGRDALICATPEDWRAALFRLVDDAALRRTIGEAARAKAVADYGLATTAARLASILPSPVPPRAAEARRTRVLIVNVYFPPQTLGGATRVVRHSVDDLLARYGDHFDLAVFATDFYAAPDTQRVGRYGSIPVFRHGCRSWQELDYREDGAGDHFAAVLEAWAPDLVHFHCVQFLAGSIVERCRDAGIPYLITAHDGWWVSAAQFLVDEDMVLRLPGTRALAGAPPGEGGLGTVDRKRYLADRLNEAAAVTAVSARFADIYRHCGFPHTRATPNGLSAHFLVARDLPGRRDRSLRRERVRIGHIGGRLPHKGLHLLQIALQQGAFSRLDALVVDHTKDEGYEAHELWGTTPVTLRGPISQDRVFDLYDDLDVLVAPSTWPESYGLVTREALALGLWVVASSLGALAEDVVEGQNGFVIDVGDARDLIRVLRIIDADPEHFTRSPSVAYEPRPATRQTDEFVAIYREIAGRRPGG